MESLSKDTESSLGRFVHSMGPDPFRALPVGKCINTDRDFSATLQAMAQLGLSEEAQGEITKVYQFPKLTSCPVPRSGKIVSANVKKTS